MEFKLLRTAAPELLDFIASTDLLAFDTETTGVSKGSKVIGFSVSNGEKAYYLIVSEWDGEKLIHTNADSARVLRALKHKMLIGHNIGFDVRMCLDTFNIDLGAAVYCDTMLLAHTLDENKFNYGLKVLSADIFGKKAVQESDDLTAHLKSKGGSKNEMYKADSDILGKYACKDVILTFNLFKHLDNQLSDELRTFFYEDEVMPLLKNVCIKMEYNGIPVDVRLLETAHYEISRDMTELHDEIQKTIEPLLGDFKVWWLNNQFPPARSGSFLQGWLKYRKVDWKLTGKGSFKLAKTDLGRIADCLEKQVVEQKARIPQNDILLTQLQMWTDSGKPEMFNIQSKHHLKRLFFEILKETPLSKTDLGNPQVTDDFLDLMAQKYQWCELLRTYNKLLKIKSTYIEQYLNEQVDGIYYPRFQQHKTTSGRLAGTTQQLPRPLKDGDERVLKYNNMIKNFFRAEEGYIFADMDYDSQEVRVFAHVSGEPAIKSLFSRGDDFYSAVCIAAEGLEGYSANKKADNYLGKVNKEARQRAKAYALGIAFGETPYKLKFELGVSEFEAQRIYDNYFKSFPMVKQLLDESKAFALKHGYVITESGRVRRYDNLIASYNQYGERLFNGLELWKEYHEYPQTYEKAKKTAKYVKNCLNNAMNVKAQGLAASITNRSAIAISKALELDCYICNITHDQITVHCPEKKLKKVLALMSDLMQNTYKISVPLPAPAGWGHTFLESKEERTEEELRVLKL